MTQGTYIRTLRLAWIVLSSFAAAAGAFLAYVAYIQASGELSEEIAHRLDGYWLLWSLAFTLILISLRSASWNDQQLKVRFLPVLARVLAAVAGIFFVWHLVRFSSRITLNGTWISDEGLIVDSGAMPPRLFLALLAAAVATVELVLERSRWARRRQEGRSPRKHLSGEAKLTESGTIRP